MTTRELNRDITRLWKKYQIWRNTSAMQLTTKEELTKFWQESEQKQEEMKREFLRLWNADKEKIYTSHKNLKRLIIINQSLRPLALHHIATGWKA